MADDQFIVAESADGVLHEFPAGTADSVIDGVMRTYARAQAPEEPKKWGITDDMSRGLQQARSEAQGLGATVAGRRLGELEAAKTKADKGEFLSPIERSMVAQYEEAKANATRHLSDTVGKSIEYRQKAEDLPIRPEYKEFKEAAGKGAGEALAAFWKSPGKVLTSMLAEGLPAMAPTVVGALAAGPLGGAAVASTQTYLQSYAGKVVELLGERGIDTNDKDAVMAALSNPDVSDEIRRKAGLQAIPPAVAAGASMGVAGKTIAPAAMGPVARQVINVPAQAGTQGALSAAGEAAAPLTTGDPVHGGAVVAAGIGGAAQGPVDAAVLAARGGYIAARERTSAKSPLEVAKPVLDAPDTDSAIKAAADIVEGTPVDVDAMLTQAREFGGEAEQRQAGLNKLFGGLNEGAVESLPDGSYQYRTDQDAIALKTWEPGRDKAPEGAEAITPEVAAAQRAHYDKLGVKVVYFENDNAIPFDGAVDPAQPNTIFLSNNPTRNAAQVGAHEITHLFESTRLPDGTNLGDLLHQQITEGVTGEGLDYAGRTFGQTAPDRAQFPNTPEGQAAHADAIVSHLIRELGADIGGEAPKFQTFAPRVVEAVEARYGLEAAKDVLQKLIAGIRETMATLRQFFSKPAEGAEYGQPETASQKWVTNLEAIHDTLAKMYAERYQSQVERERALLESQRPVRDAPVEEVAPRAIQPEPLPEGTPARPESTVAAEPPAAPEVAAPRSPGPIAEQPYAEARDRAERLERWLGELDAERRQKAETSPEAQQVRATIDTILGKVKGIEERLTKAAAERLQMARARLERLTNPEGDSQDMALVRSQLAEERQRMADAAAVGTGPAPGTARAGAAPERAQPVVAVAPVRGRAVMPDAPKVPETLEAKPNSVSAEPNRTEVVAPAPVAEMPQAAEPAVTPRAPAEEATAAVRSAVTESGLPDRLTPEIARFYRPEAGQDPTIAFDTAFNRWLAVEEVKARRAVGDDAVVTPEILKAVSDADPVLKEAFRDLEEHYTRNGNEIPDDITPVREEPARASETARPETAPEEAGRLESNETGGELGSGGRVPDQAPEVDALVAAEATTPKRTRTPRTTAAGRVPPPEAIVDAGEKIGGARKDLWAERGLRASDLEAMTEGEAYQHTTKDAVWPKPDYAAMVEGGMTPHAAALVKIIRDRLGARPAIDSAEGRRNYVTMMGHVRDVLSEVKTKDDMRSARERIVHELAGVQRGMGGMYGEDGKAARALLFSVYKGRQEPFRVNYAEQRKAQEMVEAGFPGKAEPWTRRYEVRQWGGDTFAVVSKGERRVIEGRKFETHKEAEAFAKETYEKAAESGEAAPLPKRPHLDNVLRTGEDIREGANVKGDDFVRDFGFRGVEFGNWVASDERAKSVNLAYDALHDMAGVIGVPAKALSLDGQLGLAFGARGSGKAAAHYEPGRLVINLTKMSGAGSLAHEWGHAVDHYFGTLDTGENTRGAPKGASGWYDRTEQRASYLKNLRPEMAQAFDGVMDAIFKREKPRAEAVRDAELRIERLQAGIDSYRDRAEKSADPTFKKSVATWLESQKLQLEAAGRRLADLRDEEKPYNGQKVTSSYYDEANKLSGKSGEKGYWSRPTEMFARAFESYVFDKIKAEGNESQYLVQGVEPERYASGYKGNPYPAAERPAINAAFDKLFETMDVREGDKGPALFSPKTYTDEQKKAMARVFGEQKQTGLMEWIGENKQGLGKKFVANALDPYRPILEYSPQAYIAARNANTSTASFNAFLTEGPLKFDGDAYNLAKRNGGVENYLFRPLGDEAGDFLKWVAGNRAERLKAEDRENLFTDADIKAIKTMNQGRLDFDYTLSNGKTTRSREAAYLDSLKKLDETNRSVMELDVESGLVKRDQADALLANPYYVNFRRVAEDSGSTSFAGATSAGLTKQYAFKKLKGGTDKLNADLWQNMMGTWEHQIDAALKNKAARQILGEAEKANATRRLTAQEAAHLSDKDLKNRTVWVMEDGQKVHYAVEDPLLLRAVSALHRDELWGGPIMDGLRGFKKLLTVGVTTNPVFIAKNFIRANAHDVGIAPLSPNILKNIVTGFRANDIGGDLQNVALALGGRDLKPRNVSDSAASAMAGGGLMNFSVANDIGAQKARIALDTPDAIKKFWNYIGTTADAYRAVGGQAEQFNRIALYEKLRGEGVPHDAASFAARDLMDFTLRGPAATVRFLTDTVPFLNAWLQGTYKTGRALGNADTDLPLAGPGRKPASSVARAAGMLGAVTLGLLALDAFYADDPDYQRREEYDRNANIWFKIGDAEFRIPMGFEIAALARIAANGAEVFFDKNMTGERFQKNLLSIVGTNMHMNPIPQAFKPMLDVYANETRTGRPIENRGMERLRSEERSTINNTMAARGLSAVLNAAARGIAGPQAEALSPVQIDYLVQAYTGWLGTQALSVADNAIRSLSSEPERPEGDLVAAVTQGMIRTSPSPQSRYVSALYDQAKAVERAYATYNDMVRQGRTADAREFFADNRDLIQKHGLVSAVTRMEGDLNRQIRIITNSPDPAMTPERKRLMIQQLQARKNRAAEQVMAPR